MPLTKATHNLTEKEQPGSEAVSAASVNLHSLVFFCTAELSSMQGQPKNTEKGKTDTFSFPRVTGSLKLSHIPHTLAEGECGPLLLCAQPSMFTH